MLILADENIPCVRDAFAPLGEIRTLAGRSLTAEAIRDADVLLVRSVTRVDRQLVEGSRVRFIASATAGVDHVDESALRERGITFASAPGSNAESVAQYIAAALFLLRRKLNRPLRGRSIGIVGAGHCGSRVARIARALGMDVRLCDPPLARLGGNETYVPLSEIESSDYLTLHIPLTNEGPDRTLGMIDRGFIGRMKPGAVLINAARGGIVDESALLDAVRSGNLAGAALDAWIGEPRINSAILEAVDLGTPHIAGYSLDGKLRGTKMIHDALCAFLGRKPSWHPDDSLERTIETIDPGVTTGDPEEFLSKLVEKAYPIRRDDAALREMLALSDEDRPRHFDALRKHYPVRREFAATRVIAGDPQSPLASSLKGLGFTS